MANIFHEVVDAAERDSQASAARYFGAWKEMCRLRFDILVTQASRGLQPTAQRDLFMPQVPHAAASLLAGSHVQHLPKTVQAQEVAQKFDLWRSEVLDRSWGKIRSEKMGWSFSSSRVRLVRDGVCLFKGAPDDVFALLRQQIGLGQAMRNRTDRLRLIGNGVVPLCAAYAYCALSALLEADRRRRAAEADMRSAAE